MLNCAWWQIYFVAINLCVVLFVLIHEVKNQLNANFSGIKQVFFKDGFFIINFL